MKTTLGNNIAVYLARNFSIKGQWQYKSLNLTIQSLEYLNIAEVHEILHVSESRFFRYIPAYWLRQFRFPLSYDLQKRLHVSCWFLEVTEIDKVSICVTHFFLKWIYLVKIACQTKFHVLDQRSLFRAFQRYAIAQFSIFFRRAIYVPFEMACLTWEAGVPRLA